MKFGYNQPSSFRGGHLKLWTDGRTTESANTKSSRGAFVSGELKSIQTTSSPEPLG